MSNELNPSPQKLWKRAGEECREKGTDAIQARYVELMIEHGYIVPKEKTDAEARTEREIEKWKLVDEYLANLFVHPMQGTYSASEVQTIVGGNIRTFMQTWFATRERELHKAHEQLVTKEQALKSAYAANHAMHRILTDYGLHEVFTREVSAFHREALLPLIKVVKQIVDQAANNATDEMKVRVEEMQKFLKKIEERANHFDNSVLVDKARQKAAEELKKLQSKQPSPTSTTP